MNPDPYLLPTLSHAEFYLLLAMKADPAHIYELWRRAENLSLRSLGQSKTRAYRVVHELERAGLARVREGRQYDITTEGHVRLMSELRRMEQARRVADQLGMFGRLLPLEIERLVMDGIMPEPAGTKPKL